LGGVILLGVAEEKDKSFHPVCLPDPESMVEKFWQILNDPRQVSANILTRDHIRIYRDEENCFIAITIPRVHAMLTQFMWVGIRFRERMSATARETTAVTMSGCVR
jgi:hypothetical protein